MIGKRVQRNRHGDICRCADEDQVENEGYGEECSERFAEDLRAIDEVCDHRVATIELDQDVSAVCGEAAESENGDDSRNETEGLESLGSRRLLVIGAAKHMGTKFVQRKNADADFDCDENHTCSPATKCPVILAIRRTLSIRSR